MEQLEREDEVELLHPLEAWVDWSAWTREETDATADTAAAEESAGRVNVHFLSTLC